MKLNLITNGLLFVITVCLVLITLRLYGVSAVTPAHAANIFHREDQALRLSTQELIPVALYAMYSSDGKQRWYPVEMDFSGNLSVKIDK